MLRKKVETLIPASLQAELARLDPTEEISAEGSAQRIPPREDN